MTPKTQGKKADTDKWDCIKLKRFTAKQAMKGQPTEWERNICKLFKNSLTIQE
jgi:hypothetical protein